MQGSCTAHDWQRLSLLPCSPCCSDVPPPLPRSEDEVPVGGYRWTPTREALAILRQLATAQVEHVGGGRRGFGGWMHALLSQLAASCARPASCPIGLQALPLQAFVTTPSSPLSPRRRLCQLLAPPATPSRPLGLQVNLAILESTGIAGAVAQLRNHR